MLISHQWLNEYLDFNLSPEQLAEGLSMLGLEVEGYERLGDRYKRIVVGEVVECTRHPNADRLSLCTVDVGNERLQIVCGAPNVAVGQKVAVALVGATIPHNQHDPEGKPFVLERVRIRGVESNGMICSAYELGLGDDADGILVLERRAKVGTPLAQYLGKTDVVYEVEVTANRGDWLSHFGVAREIAAMLGKRMRKPPVTVRESKASISSAASVKILDVLGCARYSARVLRGVRIGPSPAWLQNRLTAVGVRPINNVVDATNYVMFETGQPLHAFDYDKLVGHSIIVRRAKHGERFTTLDGKERLLRSDMLMICDAKQPVAIAGVMGGAHSGITDATTTILLESAFFDPVSIRRTSKSLGLTTEASRRFERSTDIAMTVYALNRVSHLLQEITGAEVLRGVLDLYPRKRKPLAIHLRIDRVNRVLGTSLKRPQIKSYLERLELPCRRAKGNVLRVAIPSFRTDLVEEIDLIEEVARMYGYNEIETNTRAFIHFPTETRVPSIDNELRAHCVGAGFNEILSNSLLDSRTTELAGGEAIKILNPVSVEMAYLRTSLIPGALHIVRRNQFQGQRQLRLFEIGTVFSLAPGSNPNLFESYQQEERLLLLLNGENAPLSYGITPRRYDLLDIKGEVQALLSKFSLDKASFISYDTHKTLSEESVAVEINGTYAGYFGKVRHDIAKKFELDGEVFVCELKTAVVAEHWRRARKYEPLPKFPLVTRDLAFVVEQHLPQETVERAIRESGGAMLQQVTLFDVYVGEQVGRGKKSLAYALEFQPKDRTLTVHEIDAIIAEIVSHVQQSCRATLRASAAIRSVSAQ